MSAPRAASFSSTTAARSTRAPVGADPSADVAVLKVDAGNLPVVCTDDSNKVQVGDDVVAIGNALAVEGGLSVTRGIISGPPRPGSEIGTAIETVLQTDAAINPGNSGGPLVDSNGCVIGINTAVVVRLPGRSRRTYNVGFAYPHLVGQARHRRHQGRPQAGVPRRRSTTPTSRASST